MNSVSTYLRHATYLITTIVSFSILASAPNPPKVDLSKIDGSIRDYERNVPSIEQAYYTVSPLPEQDKLTTATLANGDDIVKLAKEIAEGQHGNYDSLLISHQGSLVFESYYNKGRINLPHYQASASKGYTSLAVGRAIQLGYLTMEDLHKPVLEFLKDVDRKALVPGVEKITLHHTLSMQSGLRIDRERQRELRSNAEQVKGQKLAQVYMSQSTPVTDETLVYEYQLMDPHITMMVLDAVVPTSAKSFIKTELLDKLGITNYAWQDTANGLPEGAHSINLTSRDMIKMASLLADHGQWNGEQLISRDYLAKATGSRAAPYSETFDFSAFRYGYYFWGTELSVNGKTYDAQMAWGGGTQIALALPEIDLVLAITARIRMNDNTLFTLMENRILPTFINLSANNTEFPQLEGPYLGQTPPGMKAEPFAPGIISKQGWEIEGVFAPGMEEFYFTTKGGPRARPTVIGFRQQNNIWQKYTEFTRDGEVTFSPDGKRMHMAEGYKDREGEGWSERQSLGPMFDRKDWGIMRLSASTKGTYVFDDYKSKDVIRISTVKDGKRQAPILMGPEVNSGKWTAHPFIAPDESYLIWDSEREGGYGDSDLYISFKQTDGSWGPAINMGEGVNSDKWDAYASVTPDGKYILFNRGIDGNGNNDIYWVDARVIDQLRVQ